MRIIALCALIIVVVIIKACTQKEKAVEPVKSEMVSPYKVVQYIDEYGKDSIKIVTVVMTKEKSSDDVSTYYIFYGLNDERDVIKCSNKVKCHIDDGKVVK